MSVMLAMFLRRTLTETDNPTELGVTCLFGVGGGEASSSAGGMPWAAWSYVRERRTAQVPIDDYYPGVFGG